MATTCKATHMLIIHVDIPMEPMAILRMMVRSASSHTHTVSRGAEIYWDRTLISRNRTVHIWNGSFCVRCAAGRRHLTFLVLAQQRTDNSARIRRAIIGRDICIVVYARWFSLQRTCTLYCCTAHWAWHLQRMLTQAKIIFISITGLNLFRASRKSDWIPPPHLTHSKY